MHSELNPHFTPLKFLSLLPYLPLFISALTRVDSSHPRDVLEIPTTMASVIVFLLALSPTAIPLRQFLPTSAVAAPSSVTTAIILPGVLQCIRPRRNIFSSTLISILNLCLDARLTLTAIVSTTGSTSAPVQLRRKLPSLDRIRPSLPLT